MTITKLTIRVGVNNPETIAKLMALAEELGMAQDEFCAWAESVIYKRLMGEEVFDTSSLFSDPTNNKGFGIWDERDF